MHFVHVCHQADLSLVLNCCSHGHVRTARKRGGGKKKINYLPALSSNLCPPATACASALHPRGPITLTRPPASTVMLLGGLSSTFQLAAEWSPTCNYCVIVARTGTSLQQRAAVERTHATVRLGGGDSSVWEQQDRREVKNACTNLK